MYMYMKREYITLQYVLSIVMLKSIKGPVDADWNRRFWVKQQQSRYRIRGSRPCDSRCLFRTNNIRVSGSYWFGYTRFYLWIWSAIYAKNQRKQGMSGQGINDRELKFYEEDIAAAGCCDTQECISLCWMMNDE